jgi:hypothetical protein
VLALTYADPMRDPIYDRRGHEAAHLAALRWYGYTADLVQLDLKHADRGNFGHVEGIHRTRGDEKREPHDLATIAAIGPLLGGTSLEHPSAISDIRCVDANRADGWSFEAWRAFDRTCARPRTTRAVRLHLAPARRRTVSARRPVRRTAR